MCYQHLVDDPHKKLTFENAKVQSTTHPGVAAGREKKGEIWGKKKTTSKKQTCGRWRRREKYGACCFIPACNANRPIRTVARRNEKIEIDSARAHGQMSPCADDRFTCVGCGTFYFVQFFKKLNIEKIIRKKKNQKWAILILYTFSLSDLRDFSYFYFKIHSPSASTFPH